MAHCPLRHGPGRGNCSSDPARFTPEQIAAIAAHAEVSALCVTERTAVKITALNAGIPRIYLDTMENGETGAGIRVSIGGLPKRLPLHEPGKGFAFPQVNEEGPVVIIYTSGSSGTSKGVILSHRNLIFCAQASQSLLKVFPRDRLLSVIPLAHTYEFTLGLLTAIMNGAAITYLDKPPSPVVLLPAIQSLRPTIMLTVPLFIEKIYRQKIAPANTVVNITVTPPETLPAGEVFSLFTYTLPKNSYPLSVRLEALLPSGERRRLFTVEYSGGEFTAPYQLPLDTTLILYMHNREIYRETVVPPAESLPDYSY
ncbi:hypothetical protein FACS189462_5170 [Spirochaetia bacterium]|nr:hypothetical protein FACS189462_5170 [Spirochaetia bacterium]